MWRNKENESTSEYGGTHTKKKCVFQHSARVVTSKTKPCHTQKRKQRKTSVGDWGRSMSADQRGRNNTHTQCPRRVAQQFSSFLFCASSPNHSPQLRCLLLSRAVGVWWITNSLPIVGLLSLAAKKKKRGPPSIGAQRHNFDGFPTNIPGKRTDMICTASRTISSMSSLHEGMLSISATD